MKAIVYHNYGSPDVLRLEELPKPKPRDNEVLVKIAAASVAAGDWHLLRAEPFIARFMSGLLRPKYKILGADVAGWVEAVGRNVKQFQPGDAVYGDLSACGFGGFAEYVAAPEGALAPKPARLTFEEAAAVPVSAMTALQGLRDHGKLQPGQKVLINGASGGVGAFAVQIAKALGGEVTAVCSTGKMEMARALGADHVVDYTKENFTEMGQRYDLILAVNGYHPIWAYRRALSPQGVYVMCGGANAQMFQAILLGPLLSRRGGRKLGHMLATPNQQDLGVLSQLIDAGKITPVIDRCYPLHQVAEAIRYVETGHARGKVVITVAPQHNNSPTIGNTGE
ncbi:MAG: NAD(P)-dependent alcohol dehydrogenase [Caldilineaceae bacterium]|nr:NAD(P)-dependent alcohol dehydrogenase [Caldilineaceae bacterium]